MCFPQRVGVCGEEEEGVFAGFDGASHDRPVGARPQIRVRVRRGAGVQPSGVPCPGQHQTAIFTCKFGFRSSNGGDLRNQRSRSIQSDGCITRSWLSSFGSDKERQGMERKGWSITVHDLSGSPVAAASMVTPFVASPGSDRVSRSNPGGWLILRPENGTWKPWGRLEAWRERGSSDGLGYRFELLPDANCTAGSYLLNLPSARAKEGSS
ncbi:hypothetical protein QJS10_CPA05g01670 [Acorus calamus]|uniref:Uncharacterized protein n=1 Tax=Acorus calamus TaxID=4465 RepID=A0AAV9EQ39_ACOCL|nr:hypothetical protein QJS10_CPA05g01670 [Acorus calamus]